MFNRNHKQALIFNSLFALCLLSLGLSLFLGYRTIQAQNERTAIAFQQAQQQADTIAQHINEELTQLMQIAQAIAADLTTGALDPELVAERLRTEIQNKPNLFALGLAYEPEAYKAGLSLYAPFYVKDEQGNFKRIQVEDMYDYTAPNLPDTTWYWKPLAQGPQWLEPNFALAAQNFLTEYVVPFYAQDERALGVINISHSVETLSNFIRDLDLGEEGYSYIISQQGNYIIHPDQILTGQSILALAEVSGNQVLRAEAERALQGQSFYTEGMDALGNSPEQGTDLSTWTFYQPLPATGWSIAVVLNKAAKLRGRNLIVRDQIELALALITFLFFLAALLLRVDRGEVQRLWVLSVYAALLVTAVMVWIWYLELRHPPLNEDEIVLVNQTSLNEQLAQVDQNFQQYKEKPPIPIPTGLMLESIVEGANEVALAGYLWQRYPLNFSEEVGPEFLLEKGFIFPDAVGGEEVTIEEAYHYQDGDSETIGWFFQVKLRQSPDVAKFPLDRDTVQIQIWPKSLNQHLVLVPDLGAYDFISPSRKPGLVSNIFIEGWHIERSFFSFRFDEYHTQFGSPNLRRKVYIPDLYFNIALSRNIISPLISHVITLLVINALMFAVIMVHAESSFNVLSYAAALFFVVAVSHVGMRAELITDQTVYLEYTYIIIYLDILIISINAMLYYTDIDIPLIRYKDNLIIKLLHWPVVQGALLLITLIVFYPPPLEADPLAVGEADTTLSQVAQANPSQTIVSPDGLSGSKPTRPTSSVSTSPVGRPTRPLRDRGYLPPLPSPTAVKQASLTPAQPQPRPSEAVTIRYIPGEPPKTLDPSLSDTTTSHRQIINLFIGLTGFDPVRNEIKPALATDWSVSEDGLTWSFHLRPDVPWVVYHAPLTETAGTGAKPADVYAWGQAEQVTDLAGQPRFVTAADVVYGIQRSLSQVTSAAKFFYLIKNAEEFHQGVLSSLSDSLDQPSDAPDRPRQLTPADIGVIALDQTTVQFTLERPAGYFPTLLNHPAAYPIPRWAVSEWGEEWTAVGKIQTNGPYLLGDWQPGQYLQLIKNPFWPQADQVQIDRVEQIFDASEAAQVAMYQDNLLDSLDVSSNRVENIRAIPDLNAELVTYPRLCTGFYGFVHTKPPFHDGRVRRAFSAALDRSKIIQSLNLAGLSATTFAPPDVFGAPAAGVLGQGYDPELAQASLQDFLTEKNLTLDEFNQAYDIIVGYPNRPFPTNLTDIMRQMWQEVLQVEVMTQTLAWRDYWPLLDQHHPVEEVFHLHYLSWCADYPDENNFVHDVFNATQGLNSLRRNCADPNCQTSPSQTEFDQLTLLAGQIADPARRETLYAQAEQILAGDEAAYIPLYHYRNRALTKPWLERTDSILGYPAFDNWRVDVEARKAALGQ